MPPPTALRRLEDPGLHQAAALHGAEGIMTPHGSSVEVPLGLRGAPAAGVPKEILNRRRTMFPKAQSARNSAADGAGVAAAKDVVGGALIDCRPALDTKARVRERRTATRARELERERQSPGVEEVGEPGSGTGSGNVSVRVLASRSRRKRTLEPFALRRAPSTVWREIRAP